MVTGECTTVDQAEEALASAKALCEAAEEGLVEARMAHQKAVAGVNKATTDLWRARLAAKDEVEDGGRPDAESGRLSG